MTSLKYLNFVLSFAMVCTLLAGVNVVAFAADDELSDTVAVQKFYWNPAMGGSGEHIYTVDEDEIDYYSGLADWNNEGDAWNAPLMSDNPVYRLCNYNTGEHIWVADKGYADLLVEQGWTIEQGIAFYSADADGVPVYRLWNGTDGVGCHHYTTNEEEIIGMQLAGWKLEDVAFYGVKEEEPGEKEMVAAQTGANEITVTTTTPFTGAEEFTVYHGLIEDAVESVDFDDDLCSAVITLDTNIKATEYTVECSDEEYEPAYFDGEAAKVDSLMFSGDELIAVDTSMKQGMVGFVVLDQWGDTIHDSSITDASITSGVGTAAIAATPKYEDGKGAITITATSGSQLMLGTSVPVSVVYDNSTKVAQTTLTVSATSVVADMTILDLTPNPEKEELIGERVTTARIGVAQNYFIPFMAIDQYGNVLSAEQLKLMVGKSLYVTPDVTAGSGIVMGAPTQFVQGENGMVLLPVVGDSKSAGTGVLNFLSTGGFSATKNVVVEQTEVIDTLELMSDDLQVGKPVPFVLTAQDQYGEDVDLYSDDTEYTISGNNLGTLTIKRNGNTEATITAQRSKFVQDPLTEIWCLQANSLSPNPETGMDVLTVQTATYKTNIVNKRVNSAATVATVSGLAEGTNTVIGGAYTGVEIDKVKDFVFKDSYGEIIESTNPLAGEISYFAGNNAPVAGDFTTYDYRYTVVNTNTTNPVTEVNGSNIVQSGAVDKDAKSDTYKVTLYGLDKNNKVVELSAKTFKVTLAGEIASYAAGFVNPVLNTQEKTVLYTGQDTASVGGDTAKLVVYGIDKSGNKFPLAGGYTASLQASQVGGATLALTGGAIVVSNASVSVDDPTATASVDIYATVDEKTKVVATATIECSDDAPIGIIPVVVKMDTTNNTTELVDYSSGLVLDAGTYNGGIQDASLIGGPKWNVGAITSDGSVYYVIGIMDSYGMISADTLTANGSSTISLTTGNEYTLNIASGTTSFKIPVKVK